MDLTIIIVNWNVRDLLSECIRSLEELIDGIEHEILVVDNHSSDNSIEMLQCNYPEVKLIANDNNVGFAKANNQAFKLSSGDFVLLLNPDTTIIDNSVDKMLRLLKKDDRIGVVGPKLLNSDGSIQTACLRRYPSLRRELVVLMRIDRIVENSRLLSRWVKSGLDYESPQEAEVISGSCMLLRRDSWYAVHGLDERYFMYAEDVDLCFNMRKRGWQIRYLPNATVKHHAHKGSEKAVDFSPPAVSCLSMYEYFKKNHGALYAISYRLLVILTSAFWIALYSVTLRFLKRKPREKLSMYHDYRKLMWAIANKIHIGGQVK